MGNTILYFIEVVSMGINDLGTGYRRWLFLNSIISLIFWTWKKIINVSSPLNIQMIVWRENKNVLYNTTLRTFMVANEYLSPGKLLLDLSLSIASFIDDFMCTANLRLFGPVRLIFSYNQIDILSHMQLKV